MKIHLNHIPETGLVGTEEMNAASYGLDTDEIKVISPLKVSYRLLLEQDDLLVQLSVDCQLRLVCSRCLCSYEAPFEKEVKWRVPVGRDKVVDVSDDIRQEILLEYPMKPLCCEGCKGICVICGQNLNEAGCAHSNH